VYQGAKADRRFAAPAELFVGSQETMIDTKKDPKIKAALVSIYEEIMWLSTRPNVTAGSARSWYTHVMAESVKKKVRRFTGQVSKAAVEDVGADLRLEHYKRIQTTLTKLVERHRSEGIRKPEEFVTVILDCEQVHIVTLNENYAAMRAKGNYEVAGIQLIPWSKVPQVRRNELWQKMLRGKVANAAEYQFQHCIEN